MASGDRITARAKWFNDRTEHKRLTWESGANVFVCHTD